VVDVDPDDGIPAELPGVRGHGPERLLPRLPERPLVGAGAPADDVAHRGEEVLEDVRADDRLAHHDPLVVADPPTLDRVRRRDDHRTASRSRSLHAMSRRKWTPSKVIRSAARRLASAASATVGARAVTARTRRPEVRSTPPSSRVPAWKRRRSSRSTPSRIEIGFPVSYGPG